MVKEMTLLYQDDGPSNTMGELHTRCETLFPDAVSKLGNSSEGGQHFYVGNMTEETVGRASVKDVALCDKARPDLHGRPITDFVVMESDTDTGGRRRYVLIGVSLPAFLHGHASPALLLPEDFPEALSLWASAMSHIFHMRPDIVPEIREAGLCWQRHLRCMSSKKALWQILDEPDLLYDATTRWYVEYRKRGVPVRVHELSRDIEVHGERWGDCSTAKVYKDVVRAEVMVNKWHRGTKRLLAGLINWEENSLNTEVWQKAYNKYVPGLMQYA